MFDFLRKKIAKDEKPKLYNCAMCNGNYKEEDVDFLVSKKLGKNICIRCAEYIKGNSNKGKEVDTKMKNLETIVKNRDILKKSVDNIWTEVFAVKNSREWPELSKEEQGTVGKLLSLKDRYYNQMVALDFVLNENAWLLDYRTDKNYDGFVDERFFADVNGIISW